jgi:hypothetical protein
MCHLEFVNPLVRLHSHAHIVIWKLSQADLVKSLLDPAIGADCPEPLSELVVDHVTLHPVPQDVGAPDVRLVAGEAVEIEECIDCLLLRPSLDLVIEVFGRALGC